MDAWSKLLEAAQAVVDRWDTPKWKDVPHTAEYIHRLRTAIADVDRFHRWEGRNFRTREDMLSWLRQQNSSLVYEEVFSPIGYRIEWKKP